MGDPLFTLHVRPAGVGDALVLDYGTVGDTRRILIDGGVGPTARPLADFLGPAPDLELLVITHIDNDHIAGALKMLEQNLTSPTVGDVWFNGFRHLPESPLESMGPVEGERLTTLIVDRGWPWNAAFGGRAVTLGATTTLPGGLDVRILSPGPRQLADLRKKWLPVVDEADLNPTVPLPAEPLTPPGRLERMGGLDLAALAGQRTPPDNKEANGSSIAMLVSWAGRTALLTGDAHADVLLAGLDSWLGPGEVLSVDLFKLPHHGSKANVTTELMRRVQARCYVFSSSGEGRSQHPNDQAVARVILNSTNPVLAFNHRNARTEFWDQPDLKTAHGYTTRYPEPAGLSIDLLAL